MCRKKVFRNLLAVATLAALLAGCGDSNVFDGMSDDGSFQARKESAVEEINAGNWDLAIVQLEALNAENPEDMEVKKYLASAYAGKAGFDTLTLLEEIDKAQNERGDGSSVSLGTVTGFIKFDASGKADPVELGTKISSTQKALDLLVPKDNFGNDNLNAMTEQQRFQAGLYAATQTVFVATKVLGGQDYDTIQDDPILGDRNSQIANLVTANWNLEDEATINRAMSLILAAEQDLIATFVDDNSEEEDSENDIADEFDAFLIEIGYKNPVTGQIKNITSSDIIAYLQNN